ncbi:TonB-dependent receptor domain-containing protein [Nitrobacter winogradskyi]|uniref:TonB-dependent receptor domain-containing protein n=1 Tax=Nitrobacter winogradskyi TaxID=913 RepID=UPI0002D4D0F1|nr:TonB-dependent receptor [Nitrobacter winogradskyi]
MTQGTVVPTVYSNAGEVLHPYLTKQTEVGVKYDFGTFIATAAVFEFEKQNTIVVPDGSSGPGRLAIDGKQRHRGVEISFFGEPYEGVRLLGGVTYSDARMIATQGGTLDGTFVTGVSRWQGNLGAEWDTPFLDGLTFTGRMIATGSQYASTNNTLRMPGWTRFDVGARYTTTALGNPLTIRGGIENVLGTKYWSQVSGSIFSLGAPRIFKLSATIDF